MLPVILFNCILIYSNWYSMSIKSQLSLLNGKKLVWKIVNFCEFFIIFFSNSQWFFFTKVHNCSQLFTISRFTILIGLENMILKVLSILNIISLVLCRFSMNFESMFPPFLFHFCSVWKIFVPFSRMIDKILTWGAEMVPQVSGNNSSVRNFFVRCSPNWPIS